DAGVVVRLQPALSLPLEEGDGPEHHLPRALVGIRAAVLPGIQEDHPAGARVTPARRDRPERARRPCTAAIIVFVRAVFLDTAIWPPVQSLRSSASTGAPWRRAPPDVSQRPAHRPLRCRRRRLDESSRARTIPRRPLLAAPDRWRGGRRSRCLGPRPL